MTSPSRPTTRSRARSSLTDRYVYAATRRLPEDQREDVALELRASIEDSIEARVAEDDLLGAEEAERATLVELGDPDRLAAGYAGSPQHLVGPELYPTYVRAMRAILLGLIPIVAAVLAVADVFQGDSVGSVIGHAVWTAISVAIQVCFWTTVAFVAVERASAPGKAAESMGLADWTPDQLPQLPQGHRAALGEAITNVVWLGILGGLVVWQQVMPFVRDGDERLPVLDPDLWSFWLPLVLAVLLLEAAFEVVKYRAGGIWTPSFASINTITGAVFAAPIVWLASSGSLLNPAFVAHVESGWPEFDAGIAHTVVLLSAIGIWLWDSIDGWRKAVRLLD